MTKIFKLLPDGQLIKGIQAGGRQRSQLERMLYNQYAYLIAYAQLKHQLSYDECVSAYSDTILMVINQLANDVFEGRSSLKTYLYRLFTNKCIDYLREKRKVRNRVHQTLELDHTLLALPDPARSVMDQLTVQCDMYQLQQRLKKFKLKNQSLILAWGEGYSDDELAKHFGYQSAAVAKAIRLRCLRQLRAISLKDTIVRIPS